MPFIFIHIDLISCFFGFTVGILSFLFIQKYRNKNINKVLTEQNELLHWNPLVERRGLGDLITKVNHIAITVTDVGKSLSFYVDILGLQQIRRPSFDRHGAWLTMGNIELHLIKGIPCIPPVDNLQTGHIALETSNIDTVRHKLRAFNIDVRQSLNVTNAHRSISKGKPYIIQYFFNDPDGYYIELCNCDVLTEFVFNKNPFVDDLGYTEGIHNKTVFEAVYAAVHWMTKVEKHTLEADENFEKTSRATEIDQQKFENLIRRRAIYGDLAQGFNDDQIKEALMESNNNIPLTVKILGQKRGDNYYFQPVPFIENDKLIKPQPFIMKYGKLTEN